MKPLRSIDFMLQDNLISVTMESDIIRNDIDIDVHQNIKPKWSIKIFILNMLTVRYFLTPLYNFERPEDHLAFYYFHLA